MAICGPTSAAASNVLAAEVRRSTELLDAKYRLPARCFASVGDVADPKTWKLPYRLENGRVDLKRLPAAVAAVTTGYRGKKVSGIADDRLPGVLTALGHAAAEAGKMPFQDPSAPATYRRLQSILEELGRMNRIKAETGRKD